MFSMSIAIFVFAVTSPLVALIALNLLHKLYYGLDGMLKGTHWLRVGVVYSLWVVSGVYLFG